jgi:hypothetical protein
MAFDTLKHRNIAEIHRMLERLVRFVTRFALAFTETTKIHRVLERRKLYRSRRVR